MPYPSTISAFTTKNPGDVIDPAHVNALQTEIAAIETGLLGPNGLQHPVTMAQSLTLTGAISPPLLTADQTDYNPPGLATASILRLSSDAQRTINTLQAQPGGRTLLLLNCGSNPIILKNQGPGGAANRFVNSGFVDQVLMVGDAAEVWYDSAGSPAWRMSKLSQGGCWQTVPFNVANFWAGVTAGQILVNRYMVLGRLMTWQLQISNAPQPSASPYLFCTMPGNFSMQASGILGACVVTDAGVVQAGQIVSGNTATIAILKLNSSNWAGPQVSANVTAQIALA